MSTCTSSLWLHATQLGYTLPDGRTLFTELELALHTRPVALVGRNGTGKSLLARLFAGELLPTSGHIERQGRIAHVAQHTRRGAGRVADLLGCAAQLSALQRITAGGYDPADFDSVGDAWDLEARLQRWLSRFGLDYLHPQQAAEPLSGGELARLELIAALLRDPEHLILDEPSNHLDRAARQLLADFIAEWHGGLLLISHDRALLEQMVEIHLLDTLGLHRYGGNYAAFTMARNEEQRVLQRQLAQGKAALRREQQEQRTLLEQQQRRLMRGRREGKVANQAKLLLDRQKERSDHGTARLADEQAARVQRYAAELRALQQRLEVHAPPRLAMASPPPRSQRCVAEVNSLSFGFARPLFDQFNLHVMAGERIALRGANGCGKSTLLRLLTGELVAEAGSATLRVPYALIDQHTTLLDSKCSPLENFRCLAPGLGESDYRYRPARLGIDAVCAVTPVGSLSGGERLKTALACMLLGVQPKPLLLLDEPTNHLDFEALAALEAALRHYQGTLLVISHDDHFLAAIGITREVVLKFV
ncbi:MAG TPA: ATP-binding cassette domain-containing protein [Gammaproteobacteria bacterium]